MSDLGDPGYDAIQEASQDDFNRRQLRRAEFPPDWMIEAAAEAIQGTGLGIMAARAKELARAALLAAVKAGPEGTG